MGRLHSSLDLSAPTILSPLFESQEHHLCFDNEWSNLCYICIEKRTKLNKKRSDFAY